MVQGDNRAGLGRDLADEMGRAGINMAFLVALVLGRRYSGVFGFESDDDARKAADIIKKMPRREEGRPAGRSPRQGRKPARRR